MGVIAAWAIKARRWKKGEPGRSLEGAPNRSSRKYGGHLREMGGLKHASMLRDSDAPARS